MATNKAVSILSDNKKKGILYMALGLGFLLVSYMLYARDSGPLFFVISNILALVFLGMGLVYVIRLVQKKS